MLFVLMLFVSLTASPETQPCQPCHPREVARFQASAMGQSLAARPDAPDGSFTHQPSGSVVTISRKGGVLHHRLQEGGLTADYPIAYSIGAGKVGKSFFIELNGRLFQSPASFYSRTNEWGASPGYEHEKLLDFNRRITSDCLTCHAGSVAKDLKAISCERCHGPSEQHLRNPVPGSIVNPARLAGRQRDSVCEQCHLEGAAVVLNPGKTWSDFRPGEPLESTESHYVYRTNSTRQLSIAAVSHAEELALSACRRSSSGRLWCGTCHDPHGEPEDRQKQISQVCRTCHAQGQIASFHPGGEAANCIACHMPRRQATDIAHAAVTDHRIVRRPTDAPVEKEDVTLAAWQAPLPELAARGLGLALFDTAKSDGSGPEFQRSFVLLRQVSNAQKDVQVIAAQGYMLLGSGQARAALPLFEQTVEQSPASAEYELDLGVAQVAAEQTADALRSFRKSMALDPYDERPYRALANLYLKLNRAALAKESTEAYLKLVPQSIRMRQH